MTTNSSKTNLFEKLSLVNFDGDEIGIVEKDDHCLVPVKPICERLGLEWKNQHRNLQEDIVLSSKIIATMIVAKDHKQREMTCLPLEYLNGWLFKINPVRYEGDAREKIIRYQEECYQTLFIHFFPPSKSQIDRKKRKTASIRAELTALKTKRDMARQAKEEARRILNGEGNIDELKPYPQLRALTMAEMKIMEDSVE